MYRWASQNNNRGINLSRVKSWRHHRKMIHKRINQKKAWIPLQLLLFPKLLWHHFQVEETPPIGKYFFSPDKKDIIKGRTRKRKIEQIGDARLKQVMVWDASKLDDLEFVDEVVDSMGAFVLANK